MTSQITPAGIEPARRARSTLASVWPVRSSTPPGLAFSGLTWPGWTRSPGRVARVDGDLDRVRAVVRRDAGRDALAGLDRDRERRLQRRLVLGRHQLEAELVAALGRQREADPAARLLGHEVDRLGRDELRRHHEVALVLAVLVVADDDHPPAADLLDRLLDRRERRRRLLPAHRLAQSAVTSSRSTCLARMSTSTFTRSPGRAAPRVVRCSVSGISDDVEAVAVERGDGQAHAVERDRALLDDVAQQRSARSRRSITPRSRPRATAPTSPTPSTWPCTMWPPRRSPARSAQLEVHARARRAARRASCAAASRASTSARKRRPSTSRAPSGRRR